MYKARIKSPCYLMYDYKLNFDPELLLYDIQFM